MKVYSLRKGAPAPPPNAVYVGRPNPRRGDCPDNPWGNPFRCCYESENPAQVQGRAWACAEFEKYAEARLLRDPHWLEPLRSKNLICWCAPLRCHADTLLSLANLDLESGFDMPIVTHHYRCLACGRQDTCGDCIRIYCPECAKKPKACRKCGRIEPQDRFGFTGVCSVCWKEGNDAVAADISKADLTEHPHTKGGE